MKVVCDTNVLVSGLLFEGPPFKIVQMAFAGSMGLVLTRDILRETEEVLLRAKFRLSPAQIFEMLSLLREAFDIVNPIVKIRDIAADPDDNIILEAAQAGAIDFIISGDKHLLRLAEWRGIQILSPAQFISTLEQEL